LVWHTEDIFWPKRVRADLQKHTANSRAAAEQNDKRIIKDMQLKQGESFLDTRNAFKVSNLL
jgi:hypothetical protein